VEAGGTGVSGEVVVYATQRHAASTRGVLGEACRALGLSVLLELFGGNGAMFQRLRNRRASPFADILLWFGPYAAQFAAGADVLEAHQPAELPPPSVRHPGRLWSAVEFQPFRAFGDPALSDLAGASRLGVPDPERSEAGTMLLLATLDRARQTSGNVEEAWTAWQQRARAGMRVVEDEAAALAAVRAGRATYAATLENEGTPLIGLAPVAHAVSLAANAPNEADGRRLIDWLLGPAAAASSTRLSGWSADTNGLGALLASTPPLDVEWATGQYNAVRRRWAESGFGPAVETT
jgi:hypothetical protein